MKTFQFEIAGTKFRMAAYKQAQVTRGDRLTLVPEPGNQYDPKAIKIMKGDLHIGYVPKTHNKQIHEDVTQRPAELGCCVDAAWVSGAWVVVNIEEKEESNEQTTVDTK